MSWGRVRAAIIEGEGTWRRTEHLLREDGQVSNLYHSFPQCRQRIFIEFINPVMSLPCLKASAAAHWPPLRPQPPFSHSQTPLLPTAFITRLYVQISPLLLTSSVILDKLLTSLQLSFLKLGKYDNLSYSVIVRIKWFEIKFLEKCPAHSKYYRRAGY